MYVQGFQCVDMNFKTLLLTATNLQKTPYITVFFEHSSLLPVLLLTCYQLLQQPKPFFRRILLWLRK
jgi:hypothetical protein